jgi:hypothetical protein
VTKYPSCPTNQYYSDTSGAQSSYFSPATGSPPFKTCTNCLTISLAFPKYVSGSCSNISASTVSNVLPTTGYFYNGFNTGSAYVLGTPGSLTQCSLPGTSQWTTVACSNVSNTQFSTFTNVFSCSSNVTYFTKRSVSGDAYTLGANSICSNCLDYQWKSTCSPTNVSTALGMYNVKISGATGLSDPRSLASDLVSGNIYVANGADHTIYVGIPNGSGGYTQQLFFGTGSPAVLYNPIAIKYSSGYLYVYEQNSALSNLSKITTTVPITKTFLTRFPATSNTINEFAVRGGFLYLPDSKYANIWRVDTNTGITTQFIGPTNPINKPYSIYFDSTGSLFVADGGNYTIQKYNSSGVFQTNVYTGSSSTFIPRSISIDSNDNIIISNSIVAKIQILLQNGNLSNLVGGGSTFSSATAVGLGSSVKLGGYNSVGNIIRGTTIDSSGNVFFVSNVFTVSKIY